MRKTSLSLSIVLGFLLGQKMLWCDLRAYLIYKRARKTSQFDIQRKGNGRRGHELDQVNSANLLFVF